MSTPEFRLNASDRESPLWRALSGHLSERRDMLRAKNDASQPIEQTEKLRGRIEELNYVLDLATERKRPTT